MAKKASYDKNEVIADWKTGKYSIRSLANKHRVSHGTVHVLVKGVEHTLAPLIDAEVAIKQELANLPRHEVDRFTKEVDERIKHIQFFTDAAVLNVQQAMAAKCIDQSDFKARAETIIKGKETVLGKEPSTAIQINNQSTQTVIQASDDELLNIATRGC